MPECVAVFEELCHALGAAHAAGVFHLDLKPENVFRARVHAVARQTTLKVLDFGISKIVSEHQRSANLTQAIGTPFWMAPEQASGGRVSGASDVWSLGLIAFRMLTGRHYWLEANRPEGQGTLLAWLNEMSNQPLVSASERARALAVEQHLPAGFDTWFSRCVDRERERRFANATEAWEALRQALNISSGAGPSFPATAMVPPPYAQPQTLLSTVPMTSPLAESSVAPKVRREGLSALHRAVGGIVAMGVASLIVWALFHTGGGPRAERSRTSGASPPPAPVGACPAGMVLIPAGTFQMGMAAGDRVPTEEMPQHSVSLEAFCMDRTEVTVNAYSTCVAAGACTPAATTAEGRSIVTETARRQFSVYCNANFADHGTHPVNCVTWNQADAFCRWRLARLPTEPEWEYAARGTDGRIYPWGDAPPGPTRLNTCGTECRHEVNRVLDVDASAAPDLVPWTDGWVGTAPVGSFPEGASPFGLLDMAGNVWERTASPYVPYAGATGAPPTDSHVTRGGGAYTNSGIRASTTARDDDEDALHFPTVGFRCAAAVSR